MVTSPLQPYGDFLLSLRDAVRLHRSGGQALAVLMMNLDGVVRVDEALGYEAGDHVLAVAAQRIHSALRPSDFAGWIGREQLACALVRLADDSLASLAAEKLLRALDEPFDLSGRHWRVMPQVGIAILDRKVEGESDLLRRATIALHEGRRRRETYRVFEPGDQDSLALEFDLQTELAQAIDRSELYLCYRPQLELDDDRITGAEALLRWNHAAKGPIRPRQIIHAAERAGLMSRLTSWVISTALRECAEMRRQGLDIGISINISAITFRDAELDEMFARALSLWDLPPEVVTIELSESIGMAETLGAIDVLKKLDEMGLRVSADGFGMGQSSMMRLRELPFSEMKISRSFVTDMLRREANELIVRSMIDLGSSLGLRVVADGVNDSDTCDALRFLGCDVIQGDLVSPPVSAANLLIDAMHRGDGTQSADE